MIISEDRTLSSTVDVTDGDDEMRMNKVVVHDTDTDENNYHNNAVEPIPRCVCTWKNCRAYQKAFREGHHDIYDGCIRIKIVRDHRESMAYKASLDRILGVQRQPEWRDNKDGTSYCKYTIARHHFTEHHLAKHDANPRSYSFVKPFSLHGAKKYLFSINPKETFGGVSDDPNDLLYLQCPNVPSEVVKAEYYKSMEIIKHEAEKLKKSSNNGKKSAGNRKGTEKTKSYESDAKTVSTTASHAELLQSKETENKLLKDQLDAMKSQLTFLHDMVQKLQEQHFDNGSVYSRNSRKSSHVSTGRSNRNNKQNNNNKAGNLGKSKANRRGSAASNNVIPNGSRHSISASVPDEINFDDDDTESRTLVSQWNENDEFCEDDQTQYTNGTFHSKFKPLPPHYDEEDDSEEEEEDDEENSYTECMSLGASTIMTASRSVKSLPRELELEEDEEDSDTHESLEEEAFESRSVSSAYQRSPGSSLQSFGHQSFGTFGKMNTPVKKSSIVSLNNKQYGRTSAASSIASNDHQGGNYTGTKRRSTTSSIGSSPASDTPTSTSSAAYEVRALEVTDPYGEKGTYTGSISKATGMPHGHGRLEYDEAGRWYEGDWKHGRWTGNGILSNGDGDFYKGGLKNDHKHGQGLMQFADGRTFEGRYFNGQMVQGKMTYQDGSTYDGTWFEGMRHGVGRCVFADHSIYEGEFKEGEFYGIGKMTWNDGGWYEGEWMNGEMHGRGREVRADGSIRHDGEWHKGQPLRNKK